MIWHDRSRVGGALEARPIIQHSICCRKPRGRRLDVRSSLPCRRDDSWRPRRATGVGGIIVLAVGVAEVHTTVADSVESEQEVLWVWRCDLLEPGELRWSKDERTHPGRVHREVMR